MRPIFEVQDGSWGVFPMCVWSQSADRYVTVVHVARVEPFTDGAWPETHRRSPDCWCHPALVEATPAGGTVWSHQEVVH